LTPGLAGDAANAKVAGHNTAVATSDVTMMARLVRKEISLEVNGDASD
jgi:hypothetical protein